MTLPAISVSQSQYRITASIPGRVLAGAIRNQFGWWLPTSRKHQPLTWRAFDHPEAAAVAVYEHAARRLNGN